MMAFNTRFFISDDEIYICWPWLVTLIWSQVHIVAIWKVFSFSDEKKVKVCPVYLIKCCLTLNSNYYSMMQLRFVCNPTPFLTADFRSLVNIREQELKRWTNDYVTLNEKTRQTTVGVWRLPFVCFVFFAGSYKIWDVNNQHSIYFYCWEVFSNVNFKDNKYSNVN